MNDSNASLDIRDITEFIAMEFNYTDFPNTTGFEVDEKTAPCQLTSISDAINIAVCVFYAVVFLLAIPGNLTVGFVIGSSRQSCSPSEVYLVHLMVADVLLALTLPFYAVSLVQGWPFGIFMCKLVNLVKEATFYTSILFLVCISVDRYAAIVRAVESRKAERKRCSAAVCAAVWSLGVLLSLPALYHEVFSLNGSEFLLCAELFQLDSADEWRLATRIMRHLLGFLLPLVIMLACYSVTVARLLHTRGFQRLKAMKVIVAVVLAFLLCWTPFHVATIADTLLRAKLVESDCGRRNAVDVAMFATQSLGLLHCCVNPVLYAFVGEKFRARYRQTLYKSGLRERSAASKPNRPISSSDGTSNFL